MPTFISIILVTCAVRVSECNLFDLNQWFPTTVVNGDVINSIKYSFNLIPNVFGVAEYLPEIGQQRAAITTAKGFVEAALLRPGTFVMDEIEIPNVDKNFPTWGRLTMTNGKLKGLHTFTHTPLVTTVAQDGRVEMKSVFHFDNLVVGYNAVTVYPLGIAKVDYGSVRMKFTSNSVEVRVLMVKYYDVIDKLLKSDCACVLTALEVKDLGSVDVKFPAGTNVRNRLASKGMAYMEGAVTEMVNRAVVQYALSSLRESGSWICRDYRLEKIVRELDQKINRISEVSTPTSFLDTLWSYFSFSPA